MNYGDKKYGDFRNYVKCEDPYVYIDAALRHLNEQVIARHHNPEAGKMVYDESGLLTLGHAASSVLMALELVLRDGVPLVNKDKGETNYGHSNQDAG